MIYLYYYFIFLLIEIFIYMIRVKNRKSLKRFMSLDFHSNSNSVI
jgi:hypothetical protein